MAEVLVYTVRRIACNGDVVCTRIAGHFVRSSVALHYAQCHDILGLLLLLALAPCPPRSLLIMSTRRIEPKKRSVRTRGSKLNLNADHAQHVVDDEGGDDDDDVLDSPKELSKDRSPPPPAPPPLSDGDAKKSGDDESSSESVRLCASISIVELTSFSGPNVAVIKFSQYLSFLFLAGRGTNHVYVNSSEIGLF